MKQRIRVVGLVRRGQDVLIMKKAQGRTDGAPMWELPTGKIKFGEQPEEAVDRMLEEYLGIETTEETTLKDVITFLASQGSSRLSNLYIIYSVKLAEDAKLTARERYTAYKYVCFLDDLGNYRFDEASSAVLAIEERTGVQPNYKAVANSATVYVDGSSRGNPGPAGIGYHIVGEHGEVLASGGEFIGFATSRVAEYYALKAGVEQALRLGLKSVKFVSDNLMMVNQMNGIYKVKNRDVLPIYDDLQELLQNFEACAFVHVKREQNTLADQQANLAIDRHFE